jgi:hypothetical protein
MTYHLSVRWIQRAEPLSRCAARFGNMLTGLAAIHPILSDWRRQADTKAAAYGPFCAMPPQLDELERILLGGRHFKSASRELTLELGYTVTAWNGQEEPQALSIHLDVGATERRLYPNEVRIEGLRERNDLVDATLLKHVLVTIASCWDADWGVVEDWAYKGLTTDWNEKPLLPYGGWLTYLARDLAERVSPPPAVAAERTRDGGLLMTVADTPFDVDNPVHVARLDAVQQSLAPIQESISSPKWWPEHYNTNDK